MTQISHPHCVLHEVDPNDYQFSERPTHRGRTILAWASRLKSEDGTYYVKVNNIFVMAMNLGPDEWVVGPAHTVNERNHDDLGTFGTLEEAVMFMRLANESNKYLTKDAF